MIDEDDFSSYEKMRDAGASPRQVHEVGKADGLDPITLIRLVRSVFSLSLADVKKVIGAGDPFDARPLVQAGSMVHWDGFDSEEGIYLMEARVASIEGGTARLESLKKYRPKEGGLAEVPLDGPDHMELAVSYLERPLTERLEEGLQFLNGLAAINR
jgi:hypothetical protein